MPPPRRRSGALTPPPLPCPPALRDAAAALPAAPGVYLFHGEDPGLPLYIGKSVNLRARVQAHLRNPDEARLLRQTRRIEHIRTAGEIGALLLEARLIKSRQPLLNQKLRRNRQLCSLRLAGGRPQVVYSSELDFASTPQLYGLFTSRHAALERLAALADTHRLCSALLGLERPPPGRACFRATLGRCAGACRGDEPPAAHAARLRAALQDLQVATWPFPGAVGLIERDGAERQIHVIRNWYYLDSVADEAQARALGRVAPAFDADGYRILCGPLLGGQAELVAL